MNQSIEKRLAELEAKAHPPERMDLFIIPAMQGETVTGFALDGEVVALRGPGESLEALQGRAAAAVVDNRPVAIFRPLH